MSYLKEVLNYLIKFKDYSSSVVETSLFKRKCKTKHMDLYDVSFFFSTMWVGPFWFAMLVFPEHEMTKKALKGPWFFLGPLIVWWLVTIANPQAMVDLAKDAANPNAILDGLAAIMGSRPGASAAWAHMVAGDIFVTRWIWQRCLKNNTPRWIAATSVFFGVMLMPVGLAMCAILVRDKPEISATTIEV